MPKTELKCCLCNQVIPDGVGHNPEPVVGAETGRCCDRCNSTIVIPWRMNGTGPLDVEDVD